MFKLYLRTLDTRNASFALERSMSVTDLEVIKRVSRVMISFTVLRCQESNHTG